MGYIKTIFLYSREIIPCGFIPVGIERDLYFVTIRFQLKE
jgi:hypothetical protein